MNCGNCRFFRVDPKDMRMGDCYGLPPTPLLTPAPQPNGQMGANITMTRPKVLRIEHPCSLWGSAIEVGANLAI